MTTTSTRTNTKQIKTNHLIIKMKYKQCQSLVLMLLAITLNSIGCDQSAPKEIDWSELGLGMSNQGQKQQLSSQLANNLRILVSPQRRMTKSYEFEYTNNSQPVSGQSETTYLIPNSTGQYATSTAGSNGGVQGAVGGHSAAYNALSASLASLKSRLNSRAVSLGAQDGSNTSGTSNPYASLDPSQQNTLATQHLSLQQPNGGQTSYVSVSGATHHDNQGSLSTNQASENKTIVLAIPAKINFLSDNRSSPSNVYNTKPYQYNPISQQLTLIQPSSDQYYAPAKSIEDQSISAIQANPAAIQDPSASQYQQQQPVQSVPQQPQQQYMIVNQGSDNAAGSLVGGGTLSLGQGATIYQAPTQASSPYANVKYLQPISYQTVQAASSAVGGTQIAQQVAIPQISYESSGPSMLDQQLQAPTSGTRYISCPNTCNIADPRWRKYSNARYRTCCSASQQQYESVAVDSPSVIKVGEASSKYSDDSYYQYLNRKARSRRPKKFVSRSRYNRNLLASSVTGATQSEDELGAARFESPYTSKHYRIHADELASTSPKATKEGRQYRRARNRDFDSPAQSTSTSEEQNEEEDLQQQPRAYSSDSNSRAYATSGSYSSSQVGDESDEPTRPIGSALGYEDTPDVETAVVSKGSLESPDYAIDSASSNAEAGQEEPETESSETTRPSSTYNYRRSKKQLASNKSRNMRNKSNSGSKYTGNKARGNNTRNKKLAKQYNGQKSDTQGSRANGTDYDSTQPGADSGSLVRSNESDLGSANIDEESQQSNNGNGKETQVSGQENSSTNDMSDKTDQLYLANKYKNNLNDSAVASLSKTTMHLKEILSILEKKAHLKAINESLSSTTSQSTTTPSPSSSTTYNPLAALLEYPYNSPSSAALSSALASEYLASSPELSSLKSPYRYETSGLESASLRGSTLAAAAAAAAAAASMPSSSYSSVYSSDPFAVSSALSHYPPKYPLSSTRTLGPISVNHPRKRRIVNKNHIRYNNLMYPSVLSSIGPPGGALAGLSSGGNSAGLNESGRGLASSSLRDHHNHHHLRDHHHSLLHATAASAVSKHPLLKASSLYSSLHSPYWYTRTGSPSVTNFYPYKNVNKVPYSPLLYSLG